MRWTALWLIVQLLLMGSTPGAETAQVRFADGFQCPVGNDGEGYYKARGYRPNGHLGEDWNGVRGGDTDLGDPVYATAHGLVVFARDYHLGWGNVVIIRHAFLDDGNVKYADSLYGHLLEIQVKEGAQVTRGQQIGRIGSNNGMYDAHLHFELRKNLSIGMFRNAFARDLSNYWDPSQFIAAHRVLASDSRLATVPINTFPANAPPSYAGPASPANSFDVAESAERATRNVIRRGAFKVDRFEDMRSVGSGAGR